VKSANRWHVRFDAHVGAESSEPFRPYRESPRSTSCPSASRRPQNVTRAPSRANAIAAARPMPDVAPVIITTLLAKRCRGDMLGGAGGYFVRTNSDSGAETCDACSRRARATGQTRRDARWGHSAHSHSCAPTLWADPSRSVSCWPAWRAMQFACKVPSGDRRGCRKASGPDEPDRGYSAGCGASALWIVVHPGRGLLGPLNATAYVAWLAAASSLLGTTGRETIGSAQWLAGLAAWYCFSSRWVRAPSSRNTAPPIPGSAARLSFRRALAPVSLWMLRDHLQTVLLVLIAAQVASLRGPSPGAGDAHTANGVLFIFLARSDPLPKAMQVGFRLRCLSAVCRLCLSGRIRAQESRRDSFERKPRVARRTCAGAEGARAQERLRLSRELHDIAGHKLTALKLQLSLELRTQANAVSGTVAQCLTLADELLTDIRMVVSALRQEDTIDLRTAAAGPQSCSRIGVGQVQRLNRALSSRISPRRRRSCAVLRKGSRTALRHGGATEILVTLSRNEHELVLSVEDNGAGFSPPAPACRERPARIARATGGIPRSRLAGSTYAAGLRPARRVARAEGCMLQNCFGGLIRL